MATVFIRSASGQNQSENWESALKRFFNAQRIAVFVTAIMLPLVSVSFSSPAQAAVTTYACPTSAKETTVQQLDWRPATFSGITNLVGCQNPFSRGSGEQIKSVALFFGAISPSAFTGNTMQIRIVGTPANYGFWMTMYTDVTVDQNQGSNPTNRVFAARQYSESPNELSDTFNVPVTDSQKTKILNGDFVIVVGTIGGARATTESIASVSIPYSQFTATFDGNGVTSTMSPQSAQPSTALTTSTLSRPGYTFAGWNTVADGSGTAYADGALYPFSADETIYAQWTANPASTSSTNSSLANTGSDLNWFLLGTFGASTVAGLLLVAYSIHRRQRG
ncbi:hypothetical protein M2116_000810 [Aurantimicrobium minutum]|uniref:InlB B-repeat-containing protein n=1 Tax=Aurantimicrobium minutum TaxID=708131 RepID=UPI00240660A4|nr:InlB B-repeat-containing protein [Aurantimicrobium minutum]MDF9809860.1 hypothetical protein [Aurantimicrobium minutum]